MGDPSGIGPQIILKALSVLKGLADFVVIGAGFVLNKAAKLLHKSSLVLHPSSFVDLNNINPSGFKFGKLKPEYGRASLEYIDTALDLINTGELDALVTAPVSKEAINKAGFKFSGHTEYLAKKSRVANFAMMLLNPRLKTVLLTRHIAINRVSANINKKELINTISMTYQGLKQYFSIKHPRLAVCGLNPHASDNGVIGKEENKIIK
ncbi:MAG: 4-hydroxythreonine-4-phosphate dehydrogenase PdxA, partial [Candidatus Omnitrophica bacterium]|nr:4-hydroxythreonine-4-phosphate dehydrogenase PdxA [Candidatus Omnitrophota bacterium]